MCEAVPGSSEPSSEPGASGQTTPRCVSVRLATPGDWPAIWEILREVVREGETYVYDRSLDEESARRLWMIEPPFAVFVAVDSHGMIVGSSKIGPNYSGPGAHVANASFIVASPARGRGVGRRLCEHALGWARAQGYASMLFNAVVASNTNAIALYRSLGFISAGRVPNSFRTPAGLFEDLYIMYRDLKDISLTPARASSPAS